VAGYVNANCVSLPAVSPYASPEPRPLCAPPGTPPRFPSCPIVTGFRNLGVGIIQGTDQANWDMTLSKGFVPKWGKAGWEQANPEFRVDSFNTFLAKELNVIGAILYFR
jgi:hypothetical protein